MDGCDSGFRAHSHHVGWRPPIHPVAIAGSYGGAARNPMVARH